MTRAAPSGTRGLVLVVLGVALLLLAAYAIPPAIHVGGTRVRVGSVELPEQQPIAYARASGMLDGEQVGVVEFESYQDLRNAFLDGNVHVATLPLDDALALAAPPAHARVLAVVGESREPVRLVASGGVRSIAELRGGVVAVESGRRSVSALRALLAREGVALTDVRMRLMDAECMPEAIHDGRADAVLVYGPFAGEAEAAGGHVLGSWRPAGDGEYLVLVASALAEHRARAQVSHVVDAWFAAHDSLRRHAALAAGPVTFLTRAESDRMRRGAAPLAAQVHRVERRWGALGVDGGVPATADWLASPARALR